MHEQIYKGLEVWSLHSLNIFAMLLLLLGLVMHFGMGYKRYIMRKFKVKLSGDTFDLVFTMVRDIALFLAFGLGVLLVNPDVFDDMKLAVPFIPAGTVLLGIALTVKLAVDIESKRFAGKVFDLMLISAAILQYFGFVFIMEAAPEDWITSGVAGAFWTGLRTMRSNANPELALWTFYTCFPMLIMVFAAMAVVGLSGMHKKEAV